jgi:PAS domain S-box-containing protein
MSLSNLNVGTRLALGFGLLLCACAVVGFAGWSRLHQLEQSLNQLATRQWKAAQSALVIDSRQRDNFGRSGALLVADASDVPGILAQIRRNKAMVTDAFSQLDALVVDPHGRELLSAMAAARQQYIGEIDRIATDIQAGLRDKAVARYRSQAQRSLDGALEAAAALVEHEDHAFDATYQQSSAAASRARGVIVTVTALAMLAGLGISWLLARSVTGPLRRAVAAIQAIRDGRLDNRIDASGTDETAQVLASLDAMQTALRERDDRDADSRGQIAAIGKAQAVIEFDLDGKVLAANENFLQMTGYSRDEVVGRTHGMFVEPAQAEGEDRALWQKLRNGQHDAGQYLRLAKNRAERWIQASYNPITDARGRVVKVVQYATDVTERKRRDADFEGQLAAIGKAQAIIEFDLDGTVRSATRSRMSADAITACSWIRRSARTTTTARSGRSSRAASSTPASTSASARAIARCGSRRRTTRSSTRAAGLTRS